MSRAVIVTGEAGGIGAALRERIRNDGYIAIGIDRELATAADVAKLREGVEERRAVLREHTALHHIGEPADVAGTVSFLIGDDARFVTGTVRTVYGGATACVGAE